MKLCLLALAFISTDFAFAQQKNTLKINEEKRDVLMTETDLVYALKLVKGEVYKISVLQRGIDVEVVLTDAKGQKLQEVDAPNGSNGFERMTFTSDRTGIYNLILKRGNYPENKPTGQVDILVRQLKLDNATKDALKVANASNVTTLDIDHFWEAYDRLKNCKTHTDSVKAIQELYLDRGTEGLSDFAGERDFSAERFVKMIGKYPKFYRSVRKNTLESKNIVPDITLLFKKFGQLYAHFKPFKVCFAISPIDNGGTTSGRYVLVGTEIAASNTDVEVTEFESVALQKVLSSNERASQKLLHIIAHECVHTQQKLGLSETAVKCDLLYASIQEGACDFIGELISGGKLNAIAQAYGVKNEQKLWDLFKRQLCTNDTKAWMYNYLRVTDQPADLGYFIGYQIVKTYYDKAKDKNKALAEIIAMDNPFQFLEKSGYDQRRKAN